MKTLKRFIHYYAPYRAIFFLDLLCATVISAIDLAYPQILRTLTNTLFTKNWRHHSTCSCPMQSVFPDVCAPSCVNIM